MKLKKKVLGVCNGFQGVSIGSSMVPECFQPHFWVVLWVLPELDEWVVV